MELHYVYAPYEGNFDALVRRLRLDGDMAEEFRDVYDECLAVARPKGVFTDAGVSQESGATIIGGKRFRSRVLLKNFEGQTRGYPYVVTCGRELYDLARGTDDPLERFWIDTISEDTLRGTLKLLREQVQTVYGLGHLNAVNPGSLEDFPLPCQRPLFDMLGEGPEAIGLELTPSFLMLPYKSTSGILFESEAKYENCQLCPRLDCPGRRAPYSEALLAEYGLTPGGDRGVCHTTAMEP